MADVEADAFVIMAETASSFVFFVFLITWLASALWAGRKTAAMPVRELAPLYGGGVLFCVALAASLAVPEMKSRLWSPQPVLDWIMVALCVAGFTFCWWARLYLGRLWAGGVVVREGHHVVDTGPYAIVRHPIYSGVFLGMIALAAIRARPAGIAFVAGLIVFFTLKARIEERFLRRELGEAYEEYRGRVPMLLPRWGATKGTPGGRTPP